MVEQALRRLLRPSRCHGPEERSNVPIAVFALLANIGRMSATMNHIPAGVSTLAEAIRLLREMEGLTLRGLAEKVGVTAPFLSDLEHGRRQTNQLEAFANALNVPVEELQALDARVSPDLKTWLAANPQLLTLLKDMQSSGRDIPLEALRQASGLLNK